MAGLALTVRAKLKRRTSLYCEVAIVEHCNLNCIGCASFGCIAEKHFLNIEEFAREIGRLSELSGGKIEILNILGGEPLLHPQIMDFLHVARKCFPLGISNTLNEVNIVTNGILLTQMSEEFWKTCHDENIQISITRYPIHIDMNAIHALADKYNVALGYWSGDTLKTMWKRPFDLDGKQDAAKSFRMCTVANRCAALQDGKIYACPTCAHSRHFNKKFGTHLEVSEHDYIDLFKAQSIDEVYDFMCRPVPFCRYCKTKEMSFGIKWTVSSGAISEWT